MADHALSAPPSSGSLKSSLYVSAPKIHPRRLPGRYRRIKTALSVSLPGFLAVVPWLRWDRGGGLPGQAVLFSFPRMRAYLFDTVIWAQEFYFLAALLIVSAFGLFLATALAGRVWCGFACPHTVWTDLFVAIEQLAEGDRNRRLKLDAAPWSVEKLLRRTLKHGLWLAVSGLTGFVFVSWFTDAPEAARELLTGEASATLYGFWGGFTGATYGMAGWMREQMCIYMCPWPRIQGGMLDDQSLIVAYDRTRGEGRGGEGRGHARIGQSFDGRGHCVDCRLCVQVCPTGIDIRDGAQLACIGCGLCADACDSVMDRFGLPRHLVGWSALGAGAAESAPPVSSRLRRPRILVYSGLIAATLAVTALAVAQRSPLTLSVLADRAPTFVRLSDGSVRDSYTVRLVNRGLRPVSGRLRLDGLDGAALSRVGGTGEAAELALEAGADTVESYRLFVRRSALAGDAARGDRPVRFVFEAAEGGHAARADSVFITGEPGGGR